MAIVDPAHGIEWMSAMWMSQPDGGQAILRLGSTEAVTLDGGGGRSSLEEQLLELFDQLREPLLRYLLSLRLTPERSEEIVQDTFLKLFEHLKSGGPDSNIRGWLFRVAYSLALQDMRARRPMASLLDFAADPPEDPHPDPEQQFLLDQRETRLLAALEKLPETEQRCLHLRAEGLRYREIADVLHLSVSTVADSLRRAIDSVRKEIHG